MQTIKTTLTTLALAAATLLACTSCSEGETYGKQKERERRTIESVIARGLTITDSSTGDTLIHVKPIKTITESEFKDNDSTTNVELNEYVLLSKTGIYMQILSKGNGPKLADGETRTVLNRFLEYNIAADSVQLRNDVPYYITVNDEMTCTNTSGTITGSYVSGVMKARYSTSAVPEGLLVPLSYINLGRYNSPDEIAHVRLIVPHSYGQKEAQNYVYACFYDLTYMRDASYNFPDD